MTDVDEVDDSGHGISPADGEDEGENNEEGARICGRREKNREALGTLRRELRCSMGRVMWRA